MPRNYEMSWEGHPAYRWVKMYKGVRYRITAEELGAPLFTAEASYKLANEWWRKRKAELDAPPRNYRKEALERHERADLEEEIRKLREKLSAADLMRRAKLVSEGVAEGSLTEYALNELFPLEQVLEADDHLQSKAKDPGRTVGLWVEKWLERETARMHAGQLGQNRLAGNQVVITHFKEWVGADSPVDCLDAAKLEECHAWLSEEMKAGRWGPSYAQRILSAVKQFTRFCWQRRLIELPRNLDERGLSFAVPHKPIKTFTIEEVRKLNQALTTGQSRLHFLLMLNCGMLGIDIASLGQEEVDWTNGIITRKRTKTKKQAHTPVVRYKLWPETFALLNYWRSQDNQLVLLTKGGKPWLTERTKEDGKISRSDCVGRNLDYWLEKLGIKRSPKQLRATASSTLAQHPTYKFFTGYFLGHSPRGIAERHYVKPPEEEFFQALDWLRVKLLGE
jgi:integrase